MGWTVEAAWWRQCLTPSCCLACALARVLSFPDESSYPAIGLISAYSGRGVRWPCILPTFDRVLRIKYENPDIFILEHMIAKVTLFGIYLSGTERKSCTLAMLATLLLDGS
jgi:hypothetical protein